MISLARLANAALGAGGGVRPSRDREPESGGESEVRDVLVGVEDGMEEAVATDGGGRNGDMVVKYGTSSRGQVEYCSVSAVLGSLVACPCPSRRMQGRPLGLPVGNERPEDLRPGRCRQDKALGRQMKCKHRVRLCRDTRPAPRQG